MNKTGLLRLITILLFAVILIYLLFAGLFQNRETDIQASILGLPVLQGDFQRAAPGRGDFQFPLDHGPHEEYQTEWWYYTGNLQTNEGMSFGYQLTFFRRALLPDEKVIARDSNWGVNQVYLAHFTLTDIETGKFSYWERISRGAA